YFLSLVWRPAGSPLFPYTTLFRSGGGGSAWHRWEVRAFRVRPGGPASGLRAIEAEALVPDARVFVLRVRHKGTIEEATADTVLHEDDVVAVAGAREVLV